MGIFNLFRSKEEEPKASAEERSAVNAAKLKEEDRLTDRNEADSLSLSQSISKGSIAETSYPDDAVPGIDPVESVYEPLAFSMDEWEKIILPKMPRPFSEESKQFHASFLPETGFSEDFPRLRAVMGTPFRILESGTGRILREMDIWKAFNTGDPATEWLQGYTQEGVALLHADFHFRRCIALPDPDIPFYFEPAVVESQKQRQKAEVQAMEDYAAAKSALEAGKIEEAAKILRRSLQQGTLILHEPSMDLWTKLGAYYPKGKLLAAVPTDTKASPVPVSEPDSTRIFQKEGCFFGDCAISCDGVTELKMDFIDVIARENCNGNTDAQYTCRVTATDVATGKEYFQIDPFLKEWLDDDTRPFPYYQLRMKEAGKIEWWTQYDAPVVKDYTKVVDGVRFGLPGGYYLSNCPEGVEIGGVIYNDRLVEFRPLFNAEIIPCRDHNYRLIYEYTEPEHDVTGKVQ